MSENTAKDVILDIIGRLRSRKARPDFENICHMALRKHGLSLKETEEMMNKLVQENIVIRVTYKGRTSYRNAAKCSKTRMHAELLNKKAATKLRSAIHSHCSLNNNNNNINNNSSNNNSNNNSNKCEKHRGVVVNNNCTTSNNNSSGNNTVNDRVHISTAATTNHCGAGSCGSKTCSHSGQKSRSNNRDPHVATTTDNNTTTNQTLHDNCNGGGDDDGSCGGGGGDDDDDGVGVSRDQIELWWHAQGFESALAKIDLNTVIENELLAKNIQLLPNGKFVLTNSGSATTAANSACINTSSLSSLSSPLSLSSSSSSSLSSPGATNPVFPSDSLPTNCSSFVPCSTPDTSSVSLSCQAPLPHAATAAADTTPADKQKTDLIRNGICGGGTGDRGRHPVSKNCLPKPPCKRGRPVSKRKKFLKTHGPDFQAEMPVAIHGITKCDFCLRPADMNCGSQEEELLCCKDCNTKAHPSCMNYTPELALRAHQSPWQCPTCKVCTICKDSGNAPAMLICDSCDKGFHMHCLFPPLDKNPSGVLAITGHWVCSVCSKQDIKDNDTSKMTGAALVSSSEELMTIKKEPCTYGPPTPSESPEPSLTEMQQDFPRKRSLYDGPYPNVTDYTIEDVVQFFQSKGFAKEASAFSEQEIDGKSLLLMKRDDVLVGLRDYICLGPALKIFKHVERLQWASE